LISNTGYSAEKPDGMVEAAIKNVFKLRAEVIKSIQWESA
jgi:hypothetical protein